jgi:2-polyprenyl-3-methyl-5-hydroxy-6-metoxy-1,4-benzoquinol methylase
MSLIKEAGAIHVEGIEPSDKNIHLANKYYPQLEIHHCSIEEYNTQKKYDIIISVMALNHIADPTRVFRKIEKMLNGDLIIVVPDYDYHIMPRNNYKMKIERINQSETVVEVVRPQGTIADVVRKIEIYQSALKGSKLKIIRQRPMYPTEALMQSIPVFRNHKDRPITVLIHAKCDQ